MGNDNLKLDKRIKILEDAKAKLSGDWLQLERDKAKLLAAIENLPIGFLMLDDYNKIGLKNPTIDKILGKDEEGEWTVDLIQKKLEGIYDLKKSISNCRQERIQIGPVDIKFNKKVIRIFISPIIILKKSINVPGSVILIEDITGDDKSWVNRLS